MDKSYRITEGAKCAVIGYGSWATALVKVLTLKYDKVYWYVRNNDVLESLRTTGFNLKYLSDIEFDINRIVPDNDINKVVSSADIIVLAVPSAFLKTFLEPLTVSLSDKFVLSAMKGLIPDETKTATEYMRDAYGVPYSQLGVISGPSHAEDVARGHSTYLSVVCDEASNAEALRTCFSAPFVTLSCSHDLHGVEFAGVLKNIYAIAAGMAAGLGLGDNFLATFVSHCACEMRNFLNAFYPCERDTMRPEYLGDLLVTCYSNYSRNRRLGQLIGRGCSVKSALNEMTMVAEGYYSVASLMRLNADKRVDTPIINMVYSILYQGAIPRLCFKRIRTGK
ncbi:MAG: NAD(P)-binding domain-containing protein [Bacteroidales bacterium]|nr:NAD(P)-binding domain-containing protein [Bacteroidales bacterium]